MNESRSKRFQNGITLKEHFEKISELQAEHIKDMTDLQFRLTKEKVDESKEAMEKRLDGMNEFRDALKDQAGRFITRAELLAVAVGVSTIISAMVVIIMRLMK